MSVYPSLLSTLQTQHNIVFEILRSCGEAQLDKRPEGGKWSIHDHLAHMARYQIVFRDRIDEILRIENPSFERYDANNDREFESWQQLIHQELCEHLNKGRSEINFLIESLNDIQIQRKGRHPRFGNLSIVEWLEFFTLHESHHIFAIFQLKHTYA
jgi:uncharacterized damage-inducible protein DinB